MNSQNTRLGHGPLTDVHGRWDERSPRAQSQEWLDVWFCLDLPGFVWMRAPGQGPSTQAASRGPETSEQGWGGGRASARCLRDPTGPPELYELQLGTTQEHTYPPVLPPTGQGDPSALDPRI